MTRLGCVWLLCFIASITLVACSLVQELDAQSFPDFVNDHETAVVLYYVPWCHWCKKFLPLYEQIAAATNATLAPLSTKSSSLPAFGRIDVNQRGHRAFLDSEHIMAFPTVKLHTKKGAQSEEYSGDHKIRPVLHWLMEKTTSNIDLRTPDQMNVILNLHQDELIVVFVNPTPKMLAIHKEVEENFEGIMAATASGVDMTTYIVKLLQEPRPDQTDDEAMIRYLSEHPERPFVLLLNPHSPIPLRGADARIDEDEDEGDGPNGDKDNSFRYDLSHVEYAAHIFPANINDFKQLESKDAIENFLKTYEFPTISRWSSRLAPKLVGAGRPFLIAFTELEHVSDAKHSGNSDEEKDVNILHIEDVLWDIGTLYRSKIVTVMSGIHQFYERRLMSTLGIETTPTIAFVTMNPTGTGMFTPTLKYIADKEVNDTIFAPVESGTELDRLRTALEKTRWWIKNVFDKKIQPNIKSEEPLPSDVNQGPVYILSALEYQSRVIDSDIDYLVDFYAPWCGHCRVLAPLYNNAARALRQAGIKSVHLGKIDATSNEVPGLHLRGYPSLLLYPSGAKSQPLIHQGGVNSAADILRFLSERVTHKFDLKKALYALEHLQEDDDVPAPDEEL